MGEVLKNLVSPFFERGEPVVYIATCCMRTYVGTEPAAKCRTCPNTPQNTAVTSVQMAADLPD
jgi:hypothetical protein